MLSKLTKTKTGTRAGSKCKAEGKWLRGPWSWGPAGAYLLQQGQRLGAGRGGSQQGGGNYRVRPKAEDRPQEQELASSS